MKLSNLKYDKIFPCKEIKEVDQYTVKNEPISSVDLMERAASALFKRLIQIYESRDIKFKIFAGTGNNGGDAIAVARMLHLDNYKLELYFINFHGRITQETQKNIDRYKKLDNVNFHQIKDVNDLPVFEKDEVVIDGLFGAGLSRPIEGDYEKVVKCINSSGCEVVAIDIPSGLFGEDNSRNKTEKIIKAAHTLTIEFPKLSFLFPENEEFVGQISVVPINLHEDIIQNKESEYRIINKEYISGIVKPLSRFAHKGTQGKALIVSGQVGMSGCTILSARAALRTGIGLLTMHTPLSTYKLIHGAVPEALLSIDKEKLYISEIDEIEKYNAIAIGPGIGSRESTMYALHDLFKRCTHPLVIDADAINIISQHKDLMHCVQKNSIFTPHIGEFDRLAGASNTTYERLQKQKQFAQKYGVIVILKGAYTSIAGPGEALYFNSTGNQGMATAGSGDVLTGMLTSLLAQGYEPLQVAKLGVYLHGLAGDKAAEVKGYHALIASDIVDFIPNAWKEIVNYSRFV